MKDTKDPPYALFATLRAVTRTGSVRRARRQRHQQQLSSWRMPPRTLCVGDGAGTLGGLRLWCRLRVDPGHRADHGKRDAAVTVRAG